MCAVVALIPHIHVSISVQNARFKETLNYRHPDISSNT